MVKKLIYIAVLLFFMLTLIVPNHLLAVNQRTETKQLSSYPETYED